MGNNKYKQRHKDLGLCVNCSEPKHRENQLCLKHIRSRKISNYTCRMKYILKNRELIKRQKERYRNEGRCITCSAPLDVDADNGHVNCTNCRHNIHTPRGIHGNPIV